MAMGHAEGRWKRLLRYTFGGAVCLLAVGAARFGMAWYEASIVLFAGIIILLGRRRRILRPGVSRTTGEIVCRYIPWYEGSAYFSCVLLPLYGIAMIATGDVPGSPAWVWFGGVVLLCLVPVILFSVGSMWRRCILCLSPSTLAVRLAGIGDDLTVVSRERVESVTPKTSSNGVGGERLHVEIAFKSTGSSQGHIATVLLGPQLSVQPLNLLNALVAWNDGAQDDPSELMDRIEGLLRGRSTAGV